MTKTADFEAAESIRRRMFSERSRTSSAKEPCRAGAIQVGSTCLCFFPPRKTYRLKRNRRAEQT
jgi:hypothetical protein